MDRPGIEVAIRSLLTFPMKRSRKESRDFGTPGSLDMVDILLTNLVVDIPFLCRQP